MGGAPYVEVGDVLAVERLGDGQLAGDGVDDEDAGGRLVGAGPRDAVPEQALLVPVRPDLNPGGGRGRKTGRKEGDQRREGDKEREREREMERESETDGERARRERGREGAGRRRGTALSSWNTAYGTLQRGFTVAPLNTEPTEA